MAMGPKKYRQRAEECIAIADATGDKIEKRILLQIAEHYRRIANHAEKRRKPQQGENSN
jgi:hypothetical protein